MKICSIVGVRKSGKTTTVTELVRELKSRGYRVGTIKTVFCPSFSIDTAGSNTARHREAGADIVCVNAKEETALIYPYKMEQNQLFQSLDLDYLLLEGDYEAAVPRIVCAHKEEEALERKNPYTFLFSGQIARKKEELEGLPVINCITEIKRLADLVEENVTPCEFPVHVLPVLKSVSQFCQCGCHKAQKKQAQGAIGEWSASIHPSKRRHIFLTGEKQVGKSTLLDKMVSQIDIPVSGYRTLPFEIDGRKKGYYLHSIRKLSHDENDSPISIRYGENKMIPITETFETLGVQILSDALHREGVLLLDEIGRAEKKAAKFSRLLWECLDRHNMIVGVLQNCDNELLHAIKNREDVLLIEVTKENREELEQILADTFRKNWRLSLGAGHL